MGWPFNDKVAQACGAHGAMQKVNNIIMGNRGKLRACVLSVARARSVNGGAKQRPTFFRSVSQMGVMMYAPG